MKYWRLFCLMILTGLVAGCGGRGAFTSSPATSSGQSTTTYNSVTPTANSQRNYARTIVDNSNNTINETFRHIISAVASDGSYVVQQDDPSNKSTTFNGRDYSVPTETINRNNSGQETSYSYVPAGGSLITCTIAPHGAGPNYPVVIGDSWSSSYTVTCGNNAPVVYTQTGSVVDVESITVAAGTYTALKLQSTIAWTDENGTTHTESVTNWRDVNTELSVQEKISTAYSGTVPLNGYPVTSTEVLQSQL